MRNNKPPIAILGVPFDNVTMSDALEAIKGMVGSGRPHYILTANVDFLVQARTDVELRRILFDAHLVLCDGTPVLWASRLLGKGLPERVAGADLVPLLLEVAAREGYRVFMLGATPQAAQQAAVRLRVQYPNLRLAGYYSPPFKKLLEMDHAEIKRRVLQAKPDLLFVAFGCPKQEKWLAMHYQDLAVPVAVGVGATIDFLAGQVKRAPHWMQRAGIEWVFRLAQEPRRLFRRYARDLWTFAWALLTQWVLLRLLIPKSAMHAAFDPEPLPLLPENGVLDCMPCGLTEAPRQWVLDLASVEHLDSSGVAKLMRLQRQLSGAGADLCLIGLNKCVGRALTLMGVADFFLIATDLAGARRLLAQKEQTRRDQVLRTDEDGSGVVWRGEITAANGEKVWEQTRSALSERRQPRAWQIDLSEVRFIDSTGLGIMVRTKRWAEQQQQSLTFTNLQPAVRNVLHLAALERALLGSTTQNSSLDALSPHALEPGLNPEPDRNLSASPSPVQPG